MYANKLDIQGAMTIPEITEKLDLNAIRERKWYIQGSCALTGDGLFEGLDWLEKYMLAK